MTTQGPSLLAARAALAALLVACGSPVKATGGASPADDADAGAILDDASSPTEEAGTAAPAGPDATTTSQALRVVVKPNGQGDAEVVEAILSATRSVRLFIYLLTDHDVIDALIARARAGVDVRVLLNRRFPGDSSDMQPTFDRLAAARVKVAWAPSSFTHMHAKTLVVDERLAWIMTMNLTVAGSTTNREYLVEDRESAEVAQAAALFDADYANRAFTPSSALVVAPVNARTALTALVASATRSIDVEGETFSDDRLADALVAARRRGVTVRVVLARDRTPTTARLEAVAALKAAGVPVVAYGAESGAGSSRTPYLHAKVLVVDGARAYVGSANFTANALDSNREVGVVVREATATATVARTIDADFRAGTRL